MANYTVYAQYVAGDLVNLDVVNNNPIVVYTLQAPGVGLMRLRDLVDVDDDTPANGEALIYSTSTGTWGPQPLGGGDMLKATYDADNNGIINANAGGLGADASAFSGIIKMSGGTASVASAGTDYAAASHTHSAAEIAGITANRVMRSDGSGNLVASDMTHDGTNIAIGAGDNLKIPATPSYLYVGDSLLQSGTMLYIPGSPNVFAITANLAQLKLVGANSLTIQAGGGDTFTWPTADGLSGHVMKTDGAGALALADVAELTTEKMSLQFLNDGASLAVGVYKFPIPRSVGGKKLISCDIYLEDSGSAGNSSFMLRNLSDSVDVLNANIVFLSGGGGWAPTGSINLLNDDADDLDIWQLEVDLAATGATGPAFLVLEFKQ